MNLPKIRPRLRRSPAKKPTLGLDLQGGLEVILKAQPPRDQPNYKLTKQDLSRSVSIMRNRVDKLGVSEPEIRTQGSDQIVIELAGVHNPEAAAALIGKTAQLQFYDLEVDLAPPSTGAQGTIVPHTALYNVLASVQALTKKGTPAEWYLFNKRKHKVAGPAPTRAKLLDSRKGRLPKGFTVFAVPSDRIVITCGKKAVVCPGPNGGVTPTRTYYYLFKYQPHNKQHPIPEMGGNDLKLSGTRADFDPQSNGPVVLMQFTGHGSKVFEQITAQEAQRGRALANLGTPDQNAYQHFAIVLDGEIASFPYIDFNQNPNGIAGGSAQITGLQSIGEAKRIALVPAALLPLPRRDRGHRPRRLRRFHVRGDPAFPRHADPAGLRRPDSHDRGRCRRKRRHLRTDQGRSAGREVRAPRDRDRILEGVPHDHRRERRHRHHGDGAVRSRDGRREGLCPDAADSGSRTRA